MSGDTKFLVLSIAIFALIVVAAYWGGAIQESHKRACYAARVSAEAPKLYLFQLEDGRFCKGELNP